MIKFVVAALWIAAATLGSVYYSFNAARHLADETAPEASLLRGLDYVSMPLTSIPLMKDKEVHGYFLAKLVYTIRPEMKAKLILPAEILLTDELYSYLYGNPQIDFTVRDRLDLSAFRDSIRDGINRRVGETLIHEVLVEQVDFLSKQDIRDNTARRRKVAAAMEAAINEGEANRKAAQSGGH